MERQGEGVNALIETLYPRIETVWATSHSNRGHKANKPKRGAINNGVWVKKKTTTTTKQTQKMSVAICNLVAQNNQLTARTIVLR